MLQEILQQVCVINCRRWTGKIRKYGQQDGQILINIKFVFIYLLIYFIFNFYLLFMFILLCYTFHVSNYLVSN